MDEAERNVTDEKLYEFDWVRARMGGVHKTMG